MDIPSQLSPESLTAIEILEGLSGVHRDLALELLRNFSHELRSEQEWEDLYTKHPEPMIEMAKQALKEHKEGKSTAL